MSSRDVMQKWLAIVGIGEDGLEGLSDEIVMVIPYATYLHGQMKTPCECKGLCVTKR